MAIEVAKVELKTVQDASGLDGLIAAGKFGADEVIAVIGKTEGNGGVNDFTRILADQAFRRVLLKRGTRTEAEIHNVPMVWSGGCDGVITPHATVFARNAKTGPVDKSRLVMGTALADSTRRRVLVQLTGGPGYPAEMAEEFGTTRANLSNHLTCLRECGLVTATAEGRRVRYELADQRLADGLRILAALDLPGTCQ